MRPDGSAVVADVPAVPVGGNDGDCLKPLFTLGLVARRIAESADP